MFIKQTVFILGAGSSHWCGYPLGHELIDKIISDMEDEIYIPVPKRLISNRDAYKKPYPVEWILEESEFLKTPTSFLQKCPPYPEERAGGMVSRNLRYYRKIKILDIYGFEDLKKHLIFSHPTSIDSFLQENETYRECAKQMLVYSLLKREDKKIFERQNTMHDNWYRYLLHDLTTNCDVNSLHSNKINILTFNYDTSLDFYFHSRLTSIEKFSTIAQEFLKENKILHLYGDISHSSDTVDYGRYFDSTTTDTPSWVSALLSNTGLNKKSVLNTERFVTSRSLYSNIRTMYEERNGKTQAQLIAENRDILSEAEDIIIIGFGFDQNNLIQLGFPYNEDEWNNFLAPRTRRKTIKWHNYNGQKVRISSILSKIKQTSPNIDLIEATTTDISTAYINSFK